MRMTNVLFLVLIGLTGCASDTKKQASEEEIVDPAESWETKRAQTMEQLQGNWKRVDYPYGTVEFRGSEVKFAVGEGSVEAPSFQPFTLDYSCPFHHQDAESIKETHNLFLVYEDRQDCEQILLENGQFHVIVQPNDARITYNKQQ